MEFLKLLSTSEIVAQILSFLVLFILLRVFFWKRFLKLLDDRREKISSQFKEIEDQKAQIQKIKVEYEDKLKTIEASAQAKIQEAINEGRNITEEIKNNAKAEAEKILENAKKDIEHELAKAKGALKAEILDTVIRATERLLEEKITEEKDRRFVQDFVEDIDKLK
jgi:F-type H+-transporting ATPase subunit b